MKLVADGRFATFFLFKPNPSFSCYPFMSPLTFTAVYKGKRSAFEISPISGGGGIWHLYIDQYFYGKFTHIDRWVFLPQNDDYFTTEQVAILEDQLEKHLAG